MSGSFERRSQVRRVAASPLIAACAAFLVLLSLVVPVLAGEGPTKLFQPNVTPRAGTTATTITFTVWYRNREGSEPDHVSVQIDGVEHAMTSDGTANWHDGVEFTWHAKLPAGAHEILFVASDTRKFSDRVGAGSVAIESPAPTPTPKPTPEPTSAPVGGSSGGAGSDPTPAPVDGPATPGDSGAGGAGGADGTGSSGGDSTIPGSAGEPGQTGSGDSRDPGAIIFPGNTGPDGSGGRGTGGDTAAGPGGPGASGGASGHPGWVGWAPGGDSSTADPTVPATPATPGGDTTSPPTATRASGSGQGGSGWGALATALQTLGVEHPPILTVVPMLVGTTGAMTMAFAFAIFGKKRRDEEPPAPDEVLQANAARGHAGVPGSEVVNGVVRGTLVPAPIDAEASMPRWRRPSLQAARKADPARSVAVNQPMTFASGAITAVDGRERRVIRYAVVRLLDAPDELRSVAIGQLDQGDEVQLIERSGAYWLVLCPNGQQGWIHKMTLGEIVTDAAPALSRDVDDDVLTAFLAARARA